MTDQSGGVYCKLCKKCICQPRKRKNWQPECWMICEECGIDVLTVDYRPSEDSLDTHLKVKYKDIPGLIDLLTLYYNIEKKKSTGTNPVGSNV